jgi:hypothetical protein
MKRLATCVWFAGSLGSSALLGCSSTSGAPAPSEAVAKQVVSSALTATAGTSSTIPKEVTVASTPNATCTLTSARTSSSMPVWADYVGIIHLWAVPASASDTYSLECAENGGTVQYSFDLAASTTFVPATARFAPAGTSVRPALVDPDDASQAELLAGGYFPRPDPNVAPTLYAKWLKSVSTPMTVIPPHLVERSDLNFGSATPQNFHNWGGLALDQSGVTYESVFAAFDVPIMMPFGSSSNTGFWQGIDEGLVNGGGIIQDGIGYESVGGVGSLSACMNIIRSPPS